MLPMTAVAGSWTSTWPPAARTASQPRSPSWPMPVSTTASTPAPVHLGSRAEQHVDRGAAGVLRRGVVQHDAHLAAHAGEPQVPVPGGDVDGGGLDDVAVLGLPHAQPAEPVQPGCQQSREHGRHVLHHEQRDPQRRGQRPDDGVERVGPPGGDTDDHGLHLHG
jgi:hypothetical protein